MSVAAGPARRRWARGAALTASALALIALAFVFAVANRPQRIRLSFGLEVWHGEAIHALFAAAVLGLLTMFLFGLPADLRARDERRRLERRAQALERELQAERASRRPPPADGLVAGRNREERDAV